MKIGVVVSDKVTPNQSGFSFIASREVFAGQFVEARSQGGVFLGLIGGVRISNPDYEAWQTIHHVITQKPEIDFDMRNLEVYGRGMQVAEVNVLGTYDVASGSFDFTGRAVPPGAEVHTAEPSRLVRVLSEDPDGLQIGSIYGSGEVPVAISLSALYHHVAVVGSTGSGKSYAGGVLSEELAKRGKAVVIVDPHGEYASLGRFRHDKNSDEHDSKLPFEVQEFTPRRAFIEGTREISLKLSQLSVDDLLHTMDVPGERQRILLLSSFEEFVNRVRRNAVEDSIAGFVSVVRAIGERGFGNTTDSTIIRLSKLNELGVLGDGFLAEDVVKEGTVTVLNISGLDQLSEDLMVGAILRVLFRERRNEKVPPFVLFLEEIHRYAPAANTPTKESLSSIVKEGRKFRIGVIALSQRPSDIDAAILTQCNTIIILRLFDRADIERIRNRLGPLGALESSLANFPPGRGILSGLAARFPVVFQVRQRLTGDGPTHTRRIAPKGANKANLFQGISTDRRGSSTQNDEW
jgi:uncharacterized protein